DAKADEALRLAYRASLAAALAALGEQDVAEAAGYLDRAPESPRGWEWWHLHGRLDDSLAVVSRLSGPSPWPGKTVFCPAGGRVASMDGDWLRAWDATTGRPLGVLAVGLSAPHWVGEARTGALVAAHLHGGALWVTTVPATPGGDRHDWFSAPAIWL